MIFLGYYIAKFLASGVPQRKCISLECGLQNGTLAVFVTTQLFDDIIFMVPTAAYALIMFCNINYFCSNNKKNQLDYLKKMGEWWNW